MFNTNIDKYLFTAGRKCTEKWHIFVIAGIKRMGLWYGRVMWFDSFEIDKYAVFMLTRKHNQSSRTLYSCANESDSKLISKTNAWGTLQGFNREIPLKILYIQLLSLVPNPGYKSLPTGRIPNWWFELVEIRILVTKTPVPKQFIASNSLIMQFPLPC